MGTCADIDIGIPICIHIIHPSSPHLQGGCLDTPDSRLSSATAGQIQSCSTLVAELKDNGADCSLDLSQFGFPGTPRDLCCRSCKDADLSSSAPPAGQQTPDDPAVDAPSSCGTSGKFQWSNGPQMERFEQTIDRCSTVRAYFITR